MAIVLLGPLLGLGAAAVVDGGMLRGALRLALSLKCWGGAVAGFVVALILAGSRSCDDAPSHEAGTRTVRLARVCGVLALSAAVWAAVYASSDAYVADANRSFMYHLERQREVDRSEQMRDFARARLSRDDATVAELRGALRIVERAKQMNPRETGHDELLDEIQARIADEVSTQ